jgi:hypothetical protein
MSVRRQRAERSKKRMGCGVWVEKSRHAGIVLDISATGLFIQTSASPQLGALISVELVVPGSAAPLRIEGRVARKKVVPPQLVTVAQGGVGVRIESAPEDYYTLLAQMQPNTAAATRRFRVRLRQIRGSRSRALEISAASEEDARRKAVAQAGEGWQVLACELAAS